MSFVEDNPNGVAHRLLTGFSKNESIQSSDGKVYQEVPTKEPQALQSVKGNQIRDDGPLSIDSMSIDEIRREKIRIWKNIIAISVSFMCLFTAFLVAEVLQSSLNSKDGLGTFAQATIYVSLIFSSLFIPSWMIGKLNLKWTMVVSQLCYSAYTAAQFYPTFYTLIPAAILVGFGAAPLWTAKATYVTKAGVRYSQLIGQQAQHEPVVARFFGFFFMVFQTSSIWGNLLNSLVLSAPSDSKASSNHNESLGVDGQLSLCGVHFCGILDPFNQTDEISMGSGGNSPPKEQVDMLFGILLGFSLLAAVIIAIFVDPPERNETASNGHQRKNSGWKTLMATLHHAKNPYQLLIIPLTMWTGFGLAFVLADFSAAFVVCSWSVDRIGYVMVCFGTATAISSMLWGYLVKIIGRIPIFLIGATINFCLILTMLLYWQPDPIHHPEMFFIVAGLWGVAHAVWDTQINSFYGNIFHDNKEAAFSNFWLWTSLGFAVAFAYSTLLCIKVKLYILLIVLMTGISGYVAIELKERHLHRPPARNP